MKLRSLAICIKYVVMWNYCNGRGERREKKRGGRGEEKEKKRGGERKRERRGEGRGEKGEVSGVRVDKGLTSIVAALARSGEAR